MVDVFWPGTGSGSTANPIFPLDFKDLDSAVLNFRVLDSVVLGRF